MSVRRPARRATARVQAPLIEAPANEERLRRVLLAGLARQEEDVGLLLDAGLCTTLDLRRLRRRDVRIRRDKALDAELKRAYDTNGDIEGSIMVEWLDHERRFRQIMDIYPVKIGAQMCGFKIELNRMRLEAGEKCMKNRTKFTPRHERDGGHGQYWVYKTQRSGMFDPRDKRSAHSYINVETVHPADIKTYNDGHSDPEVFPSFQRVSEYFAAITVIPNDVESLYDKAIKRVAEMERAETKPARYLPGVVWYAGDVRTIFTKETVYTAAMVLLDQVYTTNFGVDEESQLKPPKRGLAAGYSIDDVGWASAIVMRAVSDYTNVLVNDREFDKKEGDNREILVDYVTPEDGEASYHYQNGRLEPTWS